MTTLEWVSFAFVLSGFLSAGIIASDVSRRRQPMRIMEPVWVLTGLWAGVLALCAYYAFGRAACSARGAAGTGMRDGGKAMEMPSDRKETMHGGMPMEGMGTIPAHANAPWQSVVLSTLHCGAGCTLADVIGEWLLFFVPVTIGGSLLAGSWTTDYLLALIFGIGFQYAAIRSMGRVSRGEAVIRAAKADFFSLTAWQAGMYGWMAIAIFLIFAGSMPLRTSWTFWFMMQIAMCFGFLCSLPVNVLLIRRGIKHAM